MDSEIDVEVNGPVQMFDTTLRDGEQTPGVAFAVDDKVEVAKRLDALGTHVIEAGFPVNSDEEFEAVRRIAETVDATVCGLARVVPHDVDAAVRAGVGMVHVFASTSDIQIEKSMRTTRQGVLDKTRVAVEQVKEAGKVCMFSPMDATRTDTDFLLDAIGVADRAGADWINLPDTVGVGTPSSIRAFVERVYQSTDCAISIHCHNDFGLAVANSLAAVEAGARMVQVSLNGIGERAGNASYEEVALGLRCLHEIDLGIRTEGLYDTSRLIERLTAIPVTPNKPVIGANAFSHESGIHSAGVLEDSSTFEPGVMTPEMVGHQRRLVVGKHAGKRGIQETLREAGLAPSDEELNEIVRRIKSLGGKGKRVLDADLVAIAEGVMSSAESADRDQGLTLDQLVVTTGNALTPTASVIARRHGEARTAADTGVGPVDAAFKAVQAMIGDDLDLEITEFHLDAISGGSNAVAHVTLTVEDEFGHRSSSEGAHEDIVIASAEALITAINSLLRKRAQTETTDIPSEPTEATADAHAV
ncbi:MAG: 2-isopropylmalate synthase [Candidatus Bipolaricaulia bacterium]